MSSYESSVASVLLDPILKQSNLYCTKRKYIESLEIVTRVQGRNKDIKTAKYKNMCTTSMLRPNFLAI